MFVVKSFSLGVCVCVGGGVCSQMHRCGGGWALNVGNIPTKKTEFTFHKGN